MKVLLLDAVDIKSCYINIGFATIAAVLKQENHKVKYLSLAWDSDKLTKESIAKLDVDAVGVSTMTSQYYNLQGVLKTLKEALDIPILLGGVHPTIDPDDVLRNPHVDAICLGEGEGAMVDFCSRVEKGKRFDDVPNIWTKKKKNPIRPLLTSDELNDLPFPDRKLFKVERNQKVSNRVNIMAGRGCPYNCTYCINHILQSIYKVPIKDYTRIRSPERVLEELREIKRDFKPGAVVFNDDTLCYFKDWLEKFLPGYKREIGIPFSLTGRVGLLDDKLLGLLRDANCSSIWVGVESGNPGIREKILRRFYSNEQVIETFNLIKKYGLNSKSFNMLGIPEESGEEIMDTIRLNQSIGADQRYIKILTPYPKSQVFGYAKHHNLLRGDPKDIKELEDYRPGILDTGRLNRYEILAWRHMWDWYMAINKIKRIRGLFFFNYYKAVSRLSLLGPENPLQEMLTEIGAKITDLSKKDVQAE
ncbi:MAG: B12-binding domain-containing radical SAM protein [Candidatus Altiarchaeota archaeon]|nr:B12-binding domain-containing radical SAM protein [Candidatus Altiarchaeota archaeon]